MLGRASICGPIAAPFPCRVVNQTPVVFSLSNTSTCGSISGLDRAARKSTHSMSFNNGALLTDSHDEYGSCFYQFHLPKFSFVAREARPNNFLTCCSSWGLSVRAYAVSLV